MDLNHFLSLVQLYFDIICFRQQTYNTQNLHDDRDWWYQLDHQNTAEEIGTNKRNPNFHAQWFCLKSLGIKSNHKDNLIIMA